MNITDTHICSILQSVVSEIERPFTACEDSAYILSGLEALDHITGGFRPGQLVVVGGRPMSGKSALMNSIIVNASVNHKKKSLIFTAEKNAHDLSLSLLGTHAHAQPFCMRNGYIDDKSWPKITDSVEALIDSPIYIENCIADDIHSLMKKAYDIQAEIGGIDVIFVDYIQLLCRTKQSPETRTADLSSITKGLKALAHDLQIPVIAISQLSRNIEQRHVKYPLLTDFRDSGSIEEDADVVCFLYREDLYDEPEISNAFTSDIIVAKHRLGGLGRIKVMYYPFHNRFDNLNSSET